MTNEQVKNLKVGNVVRSFFNGREFDYPISEVRTIGTRVRESSKCFGHYFACVRSPFAENAELSYSLESDEYIQGEGHPTHKDGKRITGWELVA
jgi:hypothetical protein